jgi:uncharacterized damage-inducible protein DinB
VEPYFGDYFDCLRRLHQDIQDAIEGLAPEALDWIPAPDTNSLCVLIVHLTGAERYWIGDVAIGDPSDRIREKEFQVKGWDAEALKERLMEATSYALNALERLRVDELSAVRTSPRDGRQFTVGWALAHALEHTALHLGHIQLTRQWWGQSQGGV